MILGYRTKILSIMTESVSTSGTPIIEWAKVRPKWEMYIWKCCLESGGLAPDQLDMAYKYFLIESGVDDTTEEVPSIALDGLVPLESQILLPIRLKALGGLKNVNALSKDQIIPFHEKLTLVYGRNATGKSGYGRLLAKACFSRATKHILPNLKEAGAQGNAEAVFTMHDGSTIKYVSDGPGSDSLKRFSVFDSDCVPIYIDGSNSLQFAPGQLQVFDTVNGFIQKIEERFYAEMERRIVTTPIPYIFQSELPSSIQTFLLNIGASTVASEIEDKLRLTETELLKIDSLNEQRDELIKLDIPAKKKELADSCQILRKYKEDIQTLLDNFSDKIILEINTLIDDFQEKAALVKKLGSEQFNDGILKTVGSSKWKALILAAKELNDAETSEGNELKNCALCHQELTQKEKSLFQAYWQFLGSTAEKDLQTAKIAIDQKIKFIESLKNRLSFVTDGLGFAILRGESAAFASGLETMIPKLTMLIDSWVTSISEMKQVDAKERILLDLKYIDELIARKAKEGSLLIDPKDQILELDKELLELRHKQKASAIKEKILIYLDYLIWKSKADRVSFPKNKYTTARREFFNAILTDRYKEIFNEEVTALDGHIGLNISTSGRSGDTIIKLGLDFAKVNQLSEVLSEGEQKVTALADFLTEVRIDRNNCGIIFDDPVTSLDQERKEKIAQRLVRESEIRQVIIFTHDIVFLNMIVKSAMEAKIEFYSHWVKKNSEGALGVIEQNSNPRLSNLASLKLEAQNALAGFREMTEKQKEQAITLACDHLRSGCEALIREKQFLGSMEKYDDRVSIQILEEMPMERELVNKVIDMHGKISELGLMHDRSDEMRENAPDRVQFDSLFVEFCELEKKFIAARSTAKEERKLRQKQVFKDSQGWQSKG